MATKQQLVELMGEHEIAEEALIAEVSGYNYWLQRARRENKHDSEQIRKLERMYEPFSALGNLRKAVMAAGNPKLNATPIRGKTFAQLVDEVVERANSNDLDTALTYLDFLYDGILDESKL